MAEERCASGRTASDAEDVRPEAGYREALWRVARSAGTAALRPALELYFVMTSPRTPLWAKATAVGALGYLILPADAIPDWLPGIGWTDDITVMAGALRALSAHTSPEIRRRARASAARMMRAVAGRRRRRQLGGHVASEEL